LAADCLSALSGQVFQQFTRFYIAITRYNIPMAKFGKKPFTSKVCPSCGIEKLRSEYYKKGATVSHKCKPCSLAAIRENAVNYIGKYSEYQNQCGAINTLLTLNIKPQLKNIMRHIMKQIKIG